MVLMVCQVICEVICEDVWGIFSNESGIGVVDGLCD